MSEQKFLVAFVGECELSLDEIWPDGNAPENPTADDVVAEMQKYTSRASTLAADWNLPLEVWVGNKKALPR